MIKNAIVSEDHRDAARTDRCETTTRAFVLPARVRLIFLGEYQKLRYDTLMPEIRERLRP